MHADIVNIFPDALPNDESLFPLVQFFTAAVHVSSAERTEELPPLADALLEQGLLRLHCPVPLGADLDRFLSLINELRHRPGDYAALALSGGSEAESRNAIISEVKRHAGRREAEDGRAAALWQARLVLKLSELTERQEEEIRQGLRRIACREQALFSSLRDADSVFSQDAAAFSPSASSRMRLRLKAWRTMNSLGSPPPAGAFVSADQEAFELLWEKSGAAERAVIEAPLPAVLAGEDFAAKRTAFRQAAAELLADLPASFDEKAWSLLLERHYPAARHGRRKLTLHFAANADLFGGAAAEEAALGFLAQSEQP